MNNFEALEQEYNKEIQKISNEINKSEKERIRELSHLKTFEEETKDMSFLSKKWFSIKKWWKMQSLEFKVVNGVIYSISLLMFFLSTMILNIDDQFLIKLIFSSSVSLLGFTIAYFFIDSDMSDFKNMMNKSDKSIKESLRNKTEELLENEMKKPISMRLMKVFKETFDNEKDLEIFMIGNGNNEINYKKIKNIIEYKKDYKKVKTMIESIKQEEVIL